MYYVITKKGGVNFLLRSVLKVITKWMGGGQKTQNLDYVVHGWSGVPYLLAYLNNSDIIRKRERATFAPLIY